MANKKKSSKKFGKSTGINLSKRKIIRPGRPTYKYCATVDSQQHASVEASIRNIKLMIKRKRIVSRKKRQSNFLQTINHGDMFSVCNVSAPEPNSIKLRISKMKNVSGNGYRFVNLDCLQHHVMNITMHACQCEPALLLSASGKSPIKLVSELRTLGLASILMAECQGCHETFKFETSPKLPNSKRYDINVRAVWGSIVTGNGPSHMNEFLGTLDSPGMSQATFSNIEEEIGEWWRNALEQEILLAGMEEREIAINKGNYHGEVPNITVITDGGWCKRTHKHSYNALGGVAIIIGQETKKILHVGVRNKYCYICNVAESKHIEPKQHNCFKNWDHSSQAMEGDIILEGFLCAESKHGLRYMRLIGDGDSSVYSRIKEEVPIWGRDVQKLECANHVCKCLRSNLEKLVSENPIYKGKHHLSKATRVRIVTAVRCAIRMRSNEMKETGNRQRAARLLKHDITQSVHHVFGYHAHCSDFCKATKSNVTPIPPPDDNVTSNDLGSDTSTETVSDVLDSQVRMWTEGTSLEAQEESRHGTSYLYEKIEKFILRDVSSILSNIAAKSDRLLGNITTNLAESWMHIRSKFDGGKLYNICNRGSWHGRCYGGALRMNLGPQWSPTVWKRATSSEPGKHFVKLYQQRERLLNNSTKYKAKKETHIKRWKRKIASLKQSNSKEAKHAYGPNAVDAVQDVTTDELKQRMESFLQKNINLTTVQVQAIETATLNQSQSGLWHGERRKRLTASNFGAVIKRNPSLPVTKLVQKLLYSTFRGTRHTRNGLMQEDVTIEEYKLKKAEENVNVQVERMGLSIHRSHKYLGASADGKVIETNGECGLIEIKNVLHQQPMNLWQAAGSKPNFCLEVKNKKLSLRKNHDYFYQCHGLMNVCDYSWIDLVVRTLNPYQLFIQRLYRDDDLWSNHMLPKLVAFYNSALLPELACPREGKSPGIREPGVWYVGSISSRRGQRRNQKQQLSDNTQPCKKTKRETKRKCAGINTNNVEHDSNPIPTASTSTDNTLVRPSRRASKVKFVGRRIKHQWIVDEDTDRREWYKGTVLSVLSGVDGDPTAVYDILYEGSDETYEVDHLLEDYRSSSLLFIDV